MSTEANRIVQKLWSYYTVLRDDGLSYAYYSADIKGDAYEGLLECNARDTNCGAGQYFTPNRLFDRHGRTCADDPCWICCPAVSLVLDAS